VNVLIVSASMGAGHDGAARELRLRLQARGHQVTVVDFLDAFPLRAGTLVRFGYEWQLRLAPWSYEASYQMWFRRPALARPLTTALEWVVGPRMHRWVARSEADVVVSTYPMSSLVLGRDRLTGRLEVPAATFVTDFAVHPLWVHAGVDEHLCVHPQAAADAGSQAGGPAYAPGPLVPERFVAGLPDRDQAREALGFAADERVVLLVAGSWGVGDIEETFVDVLATGRYTPLAVCGRNVALCRRLGARGGRVVGWTDEMPALMAACDALVQNAGGLTCMEAFAAGLPVVSYRPIAGHGRGNAADMERAGVALYARSPSELGPLLDEATGPRRQELVDAGRAMFAGDAADHVERLGDRRASAGQGQP
jgi:UDP-N-acetylglucosamine:LPS N-acetylglucosamine transferase